MFVLLNYEMEVPNTPSGSSLMANQTKLANFPLYM